MEYFDSPPLMRSGGYCSLPGCPCPGDGARISAGEGYLYITKDCCNFRWDCRTEAEAEAKLERMSNASNTYFIPGPGMAGPIIVCELGAKKLQLNLAVAQADARHWWATGQVPFRPTPHVGEPEVPFSKAAPGGCFIATAACGSALEPEVMTLRTFRDLVLRQWAIGRAFIRIYEAMAPPVADWIAPRPSARRFIRGLIIRPWAAILRRTVPRA